MTYPEVQIILHFFLLVGILLSLFCKKGVSKEKNNGKRKLLFYYLIVQTVFLFSWNKYAFLVLVSAIILLGAGELIKLGKSVFIWTSYILIAISFLYFSYYLPLPLIRMVYLIVVVFDYYSEVGGRIWGKTALIPSISPGKTVQGLISGIISVLLLGMIFYFVFFPVWKTIILTLLLALAAFSGDLLASLVKRKNGIKDFGSLLPAQGGMLDRFDSFLMAGTLAGLLQLTAILW